MMNSGNGSGGGDLPVGGNYSGNQGGGPNPGGGPHGPQWHPYHYSANVREDGQTYQTGNTSPASVLWTYDPTGQLPPQNDRQLGILIDYRFEHNVRSLGFERWTVSNTFPGDSLVDRTARERLLAHIFEHRSNLPTAYGQLDLRSDRPKCDSVRITSYLINSLNNSYN
jgi:hypothetical protein